VSSQTNGIKIGLLGSSGKMGLSVENLIVADSKKRFFPYLAIGRQTSNVFAITAADLKNTESEVMEDVDVWIDFSSPEGLSTLLDQTKEFKTPVVSGSTGLSEKDFAKLKAQSKSQALFWASNLSPGLWAFRQAMKSFSAIADFDFAIDEIHHTQKKDHPSGTAKTLHKDLETILDRKVPTPLSHRLGGVFGIHNVIAASPNEMITFQHQALNRSVFAEGALKAALWLQGKKAGLYSMDDIFLK
jgi:4-hydroxy-tetrahydrodipicolinate reductase